MPHGLVFLSKTCCRSSAILSRSCNKVASSCFPMVSLRPVCAMCSMARWYSCTSRAAFSTSHTVQYTTASTFTGTVSLVSVCSALNALTLTRWSIKVEIWSMIGIIMNGPGPFSPLNLPIRSTTARSHWLAIWIEADRMMKKSMPAIRASSSMKPRLYSPTSRIIEMISTETEIGLPHTLLFSVVFIAIMF